MSDNIEDLLTSHNRGRIGNMARQNRHLYGAVEQGRIGGNWSRMCMCLFLTDEIQEGY